MFCKILIPISRYVPTGLRLECRSPQWGKVFNAQQNSYISYPIAFTIAFSVSGSDINTEGDPLVLAMFLTDNTRFMLTGRRIGLGRTALWCNWIAVGIS